MTIYLVRHGQAAAGVEDLDPGLSELGHRQARVTGDALKAVHGGALIVSSLRRTRETAGPIAARLALEPRIREEVAEVFDPSSPAETRRSMIGPFMAGRWSEQDEALQAWRTRAIETILALGLEWADRNRDVIIVSHYVAICAAIGEALDDDRVVPAPIANCSITTIEATTGKLRLIEAGSTTHLGDELVTCVSSALFGPAAR
ncbi:MAG: histidine phosphatase family protein [Dehalococcoidia bacterium]|nr:histidine phosphatase family protein [Dehalococcoidia bacterium]